jgi:hypothetical protein
MTQNNPTSVVPEVVVDIDVNSEMWCRDHRLTVADIEELVSRLRHEGVRTILVRCGCLGILPYHTDLSYPVGFDESHARQRPIPVVIEDMDSYVRQRSEWAIRDAEALREYNPPAVFIQKAHQLGMKVILWIDTFDDGFPGYRSKFLDANPHCQWVGRDGVTYFEGLMDYSWPEARAFRVAQALELLALGADGIHCSMSSHGRHSPNTHEDDFYGYSEPIVESYRKKHGIDIRTTSQFDTESWHDLKGEAMLQLYRELAHVCHERGKELWIGLQLGRYTQFAVDPHFSTNVVARYTNHWERIVDEGLADVLILGDYELATDLKGDYWTAKPDIQMQPDEDLFGWAARYYQSYCKDKTRLFLFGEWLRSDPAILAEQTDFWAKTVREYGFDGIDMHEAWVFEAVEGNMAMLGKTVTAIEEIAGNADIR